VPWGIRPPESIHDGEHPLFDNVRNPEFPDLCLDDLLTEREGLQHTLDCTVGNGVMDKEGKGSIESATI
jgi:hypothetical protein